MTLMMNRFMAETGAGKEKPEPIHANNSFNYDDINRKPERGCWKKHAHPFTGKLPDGRKKLQGHRAGYGLPAVAGPEIPAGKTFRKPGGVPGAGDQSGAV